MSKTNIKIERARYNLTQVQLAAKIGVSRQTIHAIETGKEIPKLTTAMKISMLFKLKVEDLFKLK